MLDFSVCDPGSLCVDTEGHGDRLTIATTQQSLPHYSLMSAFEDDGKSCPCAHVALGIVDEPFQPGVQCDISRVAPRVLAALYAKQIRKVKLPPNVPSTPLQFNRSKLACWTVLSLLFAQPIPVFSSSANEITVTPTISAHRQHAEQELQDLKRLEEEAERLKSNQKYDQAILVLTRALEVREQTPGIKPIEIASALSDLGELSFLAGKYEQAVGFMTRALTIREKELPADDPLIADTLSDLAAVYIRKGDLVTSEPMMQRALSVQEKSYGPNSIQVAQTLNNLATLYEERGDRKTAEPLFKRSLAIREKQFGEQDRRVATTLNNLGRLYMANRDFDSAEPLYKRSLKIREAVLGSENPEVAPPIINLATLYYEKGMFGEAEKLFQRALLLQKKGLSPNHPELIKTLFNLAEVYRHQRRFNEAESLYNQALELAVQSLGKDHSLVATILRGTSLFEEARGDFRAATTFLERAVEIQERNLDLILAAGSQSQKLLYLRTVADETNITLSLHLRTLPDNIKVARLAFSTILQRKGRVLDVMSANIEALRRRANPDDLALINQLADARNDLAKLTIATPTQAITADTEALITELPTKIERLEAEISSRSGAFRAQTQTVNIQRVQQAIPANACLIEFVSYRPFNVFGDTREESFGPTNYAAYILSNTGSPSWVNLGDAKRIDAAVKRFRKSLDSAVNRDYRRAGRALDQLIMRPVRSLVGGKQQLFISPDGVLNLIPFAALVDERSRYLAQRYTITYLSSGRDLLRLQVKAGTTEVPVVVANPAFHDSGTTQEDPRERPANVRGGIDVRKIAIDPLPETAREAEEFKAIFPNATMFTGRAASEATIKKISGPSILHVATHGFFISHDGPTAGSRNLALAKSEAAETNMDPLLRSGLLLAGVSIGRSGANEDGVLTALETANLNLWGTKLVVLSACETGLGDVYVGEGVFGLRRALVLAGTESQMISLWRVSDRATRELMNAYYGSVQRGASRAEALRAVQLKMLGGKSVQGRVNRQYSHPFYWASFIQSGDWRVM